MLYKGAKRAGPRIETLVFPRRDGEIVFNAACVTDYAKFDSLCPAPKPPMLIKPGKEAIPDYADASFKDAQNVWGARKLHWMVLESLKASQDVAWETVDENNPETWGNYQTELKESGFSDPEIMRIVNLVIDACGLDQSKIDEATERFLAGQAVPVLT